MMLEPHEQQHMIDLLLPFMMTERERSALFALAFGPGHPLLNQLDVSGPPQAAVTHLIQRTLAHGESRPGVPALWALLELIRQQVGLDKQVQIDRFRAVLGLPPGALPDHVFVSYSRDNEAFARRIELDLQDAGLKVWFDRYKLRGGDEWRASIERGIGRSDFVVLCLSPASATSDSCAWELNIAREQGKLIIPVMVTDCLHLLSDPANPPMAWLKDRHILDFTQEHEYGRRFKELLAALPGYNPPDSYYEDTLDTRQIPNPFRGLEAFRELDYHYFAGREASIAELMQRLHDETKPRLLAVVGASGSGKSSLVRAGLLPTLREAPDLQWETAVFKPGHQPLQALAERLELRFGRSAGELREMFLQQPTSLTEAVRATLSGPRDQARFLLVVDQCEEAFASAADGERQAFFDLLYAVVTAPQGVIHVLLTMRADFFSHFTAYPTLAALVEDNLFITTEMSIDQLRRCIEVPAQKVGLVYEQGLVDQILEAVREQPGTLPLLQYALKELYERRSGRRLTQQAYGEIGGVQGALATRAETLYGDLSASQKDILQRLMLQLVEVGDEAVTRRRARLSGLQLQGIMLDDLRAVVDSLTSEHARLLVASAPISDDNPENDAEIDLEISHEALLTHWQRLAGWIDENRTDLRRGSDYLQLAQAWQIAGGDDTSYLLTGARLVIARDWLTRADAIYLQQAFIDASADHEAREIARLERLTAEAEQAAQRATSAAEQAQKANQKAETASKHAVRNRWIALVTGIGAGAVALLAALITGQSIAQSQQREDQSTTAVAAANATLAPIPVTLTFAAEQVKDSETRIESLRLAALANEELLQDHPYTAILLATQALKTYWTSQADFVLGKALKDNLAIRALKGHERAITHVAYSADGQFILTASDDGTIRVWDPRTGETLHRFGQDQTPVFYLASSSDGHFVATTSFDTTFDIWNVVTGEHLLTLDGHTDHVLHAAFSPQGDFIVTNSQNEVIVWNTTTGKQSLILHESDVGPIAYRPNGKEILLGRGDGTVIIWGVENDQIVYTSKAQEGSILALSYSPDGRFFVTFSGDKTLLWDTRTYQPTHTFSRYLEALGVAWSPDSHALVFPGGVNGEDNIAIIWNVDTGQVIYSLQNSTTISMVAYSPDGHHVLTATQNGTATVWNTSTGQPVAHLQGHTDAVYSAAYSPDGQFIVTGSDDGTAILWNAEMNEAFRPLLAHKSTITSIAYSPDGHFAVTGNADSTALIWDAEKRIKVRTLIGHTDLIRLVVYSPDGRLIATSSDDETIILWNAATGEAVQHLKYKAAETLMLFSPDSRFLMTADTGRAGVPVTIWDVATGEAVQTLPTLSEHNGTISSAIFSPDGRFVATGSSDQTAILWDVATGKSLHVLKQHTSDVVSLSYSPDGRFLVTGSFDKTAIVWDAITGDALHTLPMTASVNSVAYSHDGLAILTGDSNGVVTVWDASTGETLHTLTGHADRLTALDYTAQDRFIISSSADGITYIWDAATGDLRHTIQGQADAVIAYSPDGNQIIQGNQDGSIMIWDANPEHVLNDACRQVHAFRDFTEEERIRFRIQDNAMTCP